MLQVVSELVTEGPAEDLSKLTVPLLQQRLSSLGLPASGRKAALILRLQTRGPAATAQPSTTDRDAAGFQPSTAERDAADAQAEEWEDIAPAPGPHPSSSQAEQVDPAAPTLAADQMFMDAAQHVADNKPKRARRGGGRKKKASATAGATGEGGEASTAAAQAGAAGGGMEVDMEASAAAELAAEGIELEQAGRVPGPALAMPPDVRPGTGALDDVMSAEVSGSLTALGTLEHHSRDCCSMVMSQAASCPF